MVVYYDDERGAFATAPDRCPDCGPAGAWRYDTGCEAPGCSGAQYECCGAGCDRGLPGSRCDAAAAAESDGEYAARVDRVRAAFGLPPVTEDGAR